jgi:hypothetical protein
MSPENSATQTHDQEQDNILSADQECTPDVVGVEKETEPSPRARWIKRLAAFYWEHEFLILTVVAILLAKAYPPLGAIYLYPQITATWIAVMFEFLMAGLGLKTQEFGKALISVYFNVFVQSFNFGVVSAVTFGVSRLLVLGRWNDYMRQLAHDNQYVPRPNQVE